MPYYRAGWLLPISQPPIRDAWIRTESGRIVAFGHCRPGDLIEADEIDLGNVAVLPGLVNAHLHLELSWMRGRIPETDDFGGWIRRLLDLRRTEEPPHGVVAEAAANAVNESRAFGTAVVGDVSNTLTTTSPLMHAGMAGVVFHELIGFRGSDADAIFCRASEALKDLPAHDRLRHALAPHAPYSVSPALFGRIRAALSADPLSRTTIHLGESTPELRFLREGTGPYREILEELDKWDASWSVPGCGPVEYLDRLAFLNERVLVVHGVQFGREDLDRVAAKEATLVTCPRGNIRTGAGEPPIDDFYESGAHVAVGTDSLASVPDLNVFAELAELRRLAPYLPARRILESATIVGASALGFDADFGTIDAGKRDALIAVHLDGGGSVEEYLVSGIGAEQIEWVAPP